MYFVILFSLRHSVNPDVPELGHRKATRGNPEEVEKANKIRSKDESIKSVAFLFGAYEPTCW